MGEPDPVAAIADGVDRSHAGAAPLVDREPVPTEFEAEFLRSEAFHARFAPGRDQQMCALDRFRALDLQPDRSDRARHGLRLSMDEAHALFAQSLHHHRHAIGIVAAHDRVGLDHRHFAAEAAKGLGHLHPDIAAAYDQEVIGTRVDFENCLVGEIRHPVDPRDRRHERARAGREDDARRLQRPSRDLDRVPARQPRMAQNDLTSHCLERLDRIMVLDIRDRAADLADHAIPVDFGRSDPDAHALALARHGGALGGGEQGLRRDAAIVEAFAAHLVPFDQGHLQSEQRAAARRGQPTGPAADHDYVMGEFHRLSPTR